MDITETPPILIPARQKTVARRNAVTLKLLFIAGLILCLQVPLHFVNMLRQERAETRERALQTAPAASRPVPRVETGGAPLSDFALEGYRMVYRSLKYSMLVMTLVFAAFFLFETLSGLRLHLVHYGLVGAALCLFYMALLAVGEFRPPGEAYVVAAVASSLMIALYSAAILRSRARAVVIGGLLAVVHSILFVVLRMENFALLAGTAALFVALGAVMFFTRNVDWNAEDAGAEAAK